MNENDLVYAIAARAKVLGNKPLSFLISFLRLTVETADTWYGAQKEGKFKNRGELIEKILTEEFCKESPRELLPIE